MTRPADEFVSANAGLPFKCLALDLEVGKKDSRIHAFAAVRSSCGKALHPTPKGKIKRSDWELLDDFVEDSEILVGHNLISFDLPHLHAAMPTLRILELPVLDTLRLNPLAFPSHPYHRLVKNYKDAGIQRGQRNNPEMDSRLSLDLLSDQYRALQNVQPELLTSLHWLTTRGPYAEGFDSFFAIIRGDILPSEAEARAAIQARLKNISCSTQSRNLLTGVLQDGWPLAYTLAWLSVSGGNSVMPPWVRHEFPESSELVRRLRDTACTETDCKWCREKHDARKELKRWFGFDDFRPNPEDSAGRPMQRSIVEAVMAQEHVLGILPTGTGKSLCYQIPALSRYDKTGALTVVISPLVALMADQVAGLEARGIGSCVTVNGQLSLPERADALDRVRMGEAGIVIVAPEQLRSVAVRRALEQREIGLWVLDEAHCLSSWGHDFRPDYRYVAKFIKQKTQAQQGFPAPVLCLTATAKPEVAAEILKHFQDRLGIELKVFDGGSQRENLDFVVVRSTASEKFANISQILKTEFLSDESGGAIVYCATRRRTEEIAQYLQAQEVSARFFHAGLQPETKKTVQQSFIGGELRVIVATNAFGMGIDKPDVRVVIHADIPGSLENYLQEAGRAGRDRKTARCVLLYTPEDVERQFGMSARSRLTRREIHGILRALRNLDKRKKMNGEVIATTGEILLEDDEAAFERDRLTDDTRVRSAVSWLEEAEHLTREENDVRVFPSSLRVNSVDEARTRIEKRIDLAGYRKQLLQITATLIDSDPTDGISTDELMHITGLNSDGVRKALDDLENIGVANNDTALTAYVHQGVALTSQQRLEAACSTEASLTNQMRELAPDMSEGDSGNLHLRITTQRLKDAGHKNVLPERVMRMLRGLAGDGREESGGKGSISIRRMGQDTVRVTLHRDWSALEKIADLRRSAAQCLLRHLLGCLDDGSRGTDLLAETTLGALLAAIKADLELKSRAKNPQKLMDRALLWLHEQEVIRLNKGLAVFRPAMTIKLGKDWKRGFDKSNFEPLKLHYEDRVLQIHVMEEYAQRGLGEMADALRLAMDYFSLSQEKFLARWLPDRKTEIARQTTPASWRTIVESLGNPAQRRIVTDEREQTNVLVLAGPGSGKTRVLVHRIAWLLRARRERPKSIIALAYNRHAAADIRRRLKDLVGDDADGVTVLTCHGLAMRLLGASFSVRASTSGKLKLAPDSFDEVLRQATALLQGKDLPPEELDEHRQQLMAGFRWILVDEYQDIGPEEYQLISALSGRTLKEEQDRLSLFAVGDDDQNIYAFSGASVEYIRRFEADYDAKSEFLTENYRSTANIIRAANAVIAPTRNRMKTDNSIRIDPDRSEDPSGGHWEELDALAHGRVQILESGDAVSQGQAAVLELRRLAGLAGPRWDWSKCAVVAREWKFLDPVRAACELEGIDVQMGREEFSGFWRLRETQALLVWLNARKPDLVDVASIGEWLDGQAPGRWIGILRAAVEEFSVETGTQEAPVEHFIEWLAEWGRDSRSRQRGLLLVTAHRSKGLQFDHVVVLDGGWTNRNGEEDRDAPRRLFYVAMTRARQTLALMRMSRGRHPFLGSLDQLSGTIWRKAPIIEANSVRDSRGSYYSRDSLELLTQYQRLDLDKVDLGYAGGFRASNPVHGAIGALSPGDPLELRAGRNSKWELLDSSGRRIGRLSGKYNHPAGMRCHNASVHAVVKWRKEYSDPAYEDRVKCDADWEVVIPELVFLPEKEKEE